ncbi:DNA gyrase inhibitor YacG [Paracoccus pacificus]|uniref:DNA gyrase inhibitor YacG n=1 Tax=Paracoccus pacificus TaxID=1463598 RepID=A0ABW4R991_9RHOB
MKPCPICGKPSTQAYRPFCSRRCADVDLGRWFNGTYVLPGNEQPPTEDEN